MESIFGATSRLNKEYEAWKSILHRNNDLLFSGYIRRLHLNDIVPKDINKICQLFWFIAEHFDPNCKNPNMTLSDDLKIASMIDTQSNRGCVYLPGIFGWGIHIFKFKIIKKPFNLNIGIWRWERNEQNIQQSIQRPPLNKSFTKGQDYGYGYKLTMALINGDDGMYSDEYGVIIEDGDIVFMKLDLVNYTLSYSVNELDFGISHYIKSDYYKVGVYMRTRPYSRTRPLTFGQKIPLSGTGIVQIMD